MSVAVVAATDAVIRGVRVVWFVRGVVVTVDRGGVLLRRLTGFW